MSDRVAVMRQGMIEQVADGTTVYDHPETAFVASFVGENNAFSGRVIDTQHGVVSVDTSSGVFRCRTSGSKALSTGDDALVFVRPESLVFSDVGESDNLLKVRLTNQEFEGHFWHLVLKTNDGSPIRMSVVNDATSRAHQADSEVTIGFDVAGAIALPSGALVAD